MCLIDAIGYPQSAVTLYIYRVGGLAPQEILLQDLNLLKALVVLGLCLDRSDPPVRPVSRARPATAPRPVRPLGLVCCQFWSSIVRYQLSSILCLLDQQEGCQILVVL